MADFKFIQNSISKKWVIIAPRRASRPDIANGQEPPCPFCPGEENGSEEVYRVGDPNWKIRVIKNKYPFAAIHEVIIHSPYHHKSLSEMELPQLELILKTYQQRYNEHVNKGQVYIFNNHGTKAGESLPHSHTQLVVIPKDMGLEIPPLLEKDLVDSLKTEYFNIFVPEFSQWPDEVWVAPMEGGKMFGQTSDEELRNLARSMHRIIQIFGIRHGHEFSFNFYIYPGKKWYLRLVPRVKVLGGFEIGTGVFVNTQDPKETMQFIKAHFENPDLEKIRDLHFADYHKAV